MPHYSLMKLRYLILLLVTVTTVICSCAGPSPEIIRSGAKNVVFVQHGDQPLFFRAGVIDTASFWATYGDSVSSQLGGMPVIDSITETGKEITESRRPRDEALVEKLFAGHDLAATVNSTMIEELAGAWGFSPEPSDILRLPTHSLVINIADDSLVGAPPEADLVLMVEVQEIRLTERFSASSALANGVTLGTNEKALTVESPVDMRAFRRDDETGKLVFAWARRCGVNYTSMKSAYPLHVLWRQPARMEEILDEARDRSIEHCRKVLASL